ncbi:hypothetical protein [Paracidobacterium acidisoli]|uniref:Uncharacterized protein n=1 Tax=Paracidobacterium acidisoli TaxID=2303751 RepID=A0A372IQG6_9BACT|nr:hypothetical protein [Paracidobacterium acidisoli]MBT9331563.1 hypothetical protein [Paracidobacterium acidisoli]
MFRLAAPVLGLAAALTLTTACKTSEDAAAAASQMTTTARDLAGYYARMDTVVVDTIELNRLQSVLLGTTFNDQDVAQLKQTEQEIGKREDLARNLRDLSASFTKLTGATSAKEVATASNRLGSALSSISSLPGGSALPAALATAGKEVEALAQEHREREAGKALDATASAVSELFRQEQPAYDALFMQNLVLAQSLAAELLKRGWVNEGELLSPILQPFHLAPPQSSPEIHQKLMPYAQQQLATQMAALTAAEKKATDGMTKALDEMSERIHQLASDKAMDKRSTPLTLADVEKWIDTATSAVGSNATDQN